MRLLYSIVIALFCAACSMSDVGEPSTTASTAALLQDPQPGAHDMAGIHASVKSAFAMLKLPGNPEVSDIHRNRGVFLSTWAMCMRNDAPGKQQYYTFFFKDRKVTEHRLSVIVEGCETETYRRLPA